MRHSSGTVLTMLVLLAQVAPLCAQTGVPAKPKPPVGGPVVLGTQQLPGDFGKIGVTYTIGKSAPLNFTLKSAAFSIDRIADIEVSGMSEPYFHGGQYVIDVLPRSEQKLLVVHFSLQNPRPTAVPIDAGSIEMTAIGKDNQNYSLFGLLSAEGEKTYVNFSLKPGQKVELYTAFLVPAAGEVPKLMINRGGEPAPVIRYDLRGKVKPLPAEYADPKDPTGATVASPLMGIKDSYYPALFTDFKIISVSYSDATIDQAMPEGSKRWFIVTVVYRGLKTKPSSGEPTVNGATIEASLLTTDGEKIERRTFSRPGGFEYGYLLGKRDAPYEGSPDPGQEMTVRLVFSVARDAEVKSLQIKPMGELRPVVFEIKGLISP